MKQGLNWKPAPENTLKSLKHGMQMFDGVEFDVRITADDRLIVHPDRPVSVPSSALEDKS